MNISIIYLSAYTCTIFKGFYLLHYSIKKSFLQYIFCEHVIFERTMMSTLCLVVNKRPVYKYREKLEYKHKISFLKTSSDFFCWLLNGMKDGVHPSIHFIWNLCIKSSMVRNMSVRRLVYISIKIRGIKTLYYMSGPMQKRPLW